MSDMTLGRKKFISQVIGFFPRTRYAGYRTSCCSPVSHTRASIRTISGSTRCMGWNRRRRGSSIDHGPKTLRRNEFSDRLVSKNKLHQVARACGLKTRAFIKFLRWHGRVWFWLWKNKMADRGKDSCRSWQYCRPGQVHWIGIFEFISRT